MHKGEKSMSEPLADEQKIRQQEYRKKRVFITFAGLLMIAVLLICAWWWFVWRGMETTDDAFIDGDISRIAPQISGRVTAIYFADNQFVNQGAPLVDLDRRDAQIGLDKALAVQAMIKARLQQNHAGQSALQATLEKVRADIAVAQAEYQHDQKEYLRYVRSGNAVSQSALDAKAVQAKISAARLLSQEKNLDSEQAQYRKVQAEAVELEAVLRQNAAQIANAQLQLSYTHIVAPMSGFASKRHVVTGDYVRTGTEMLAIVGQQVWVTANFRENQLKEMKPGQPVEIQVDALPGRIFHGQVESIQRATGAVFSLLPAENATGNYVKVVQRVPVKIVFTDKNIHQYPLVPGMSVVPRVRVRD